MIVIKMQKYKILKTNTICRADTSVLYSATSIPFNAKGLEPYSFSDFEFLPVKPNLLAVTENGTNVALNLSFPVKFTLQSSDGMESKQESALFASLIINNYASVAGSQFLLSLAAEVISSLMIIDNVIRVSVSIKGIVNNVNANPEKIKVADFVDCGPVAFCNCDISGTTTSTRS